MGGGGRAARTPFVGRARDLHLLTAKLDETRRGASRLAVLVGEAGIGKSRLVLETVRRARDRGFDVVESAAYELEHARPFGPLIDAFGDAEATAGYQMQEHVVAHVEARAVVRPLLLTLDDAHWADVATLGALAACVRRLSHLPLFTLLCARPLPRPAELDRLMSHADVVDLQPLDEEAAMQMVTEMLGASPGPTTRETVAGASGNPFFIAELVNALQADGAIEIRDGLAETLGKGLPSLRMSMLRRISFLTSDTLDALRLASALGSMFTVSDLAVVARKPATDLLPSIDESVRSGVLEERGDALRFRHDLLREALYEDMPLSSRIALHLDCARALAAAGAPAERVAPHFSLGASVGDGEAVEWLVRAGDDAFERNPAAALELYEQARRLLRPDDPARVRLNVQMVYALHWLGRADEIVALATETLAIAPDLEGELVVCLVVALFARGDVEEALARADDYVARRDVSDAQRFPALQWAAAWRASLGRPGAHELAERCMEIAAGLPYAGAQVAALMVLSNVLHSEGRSAEAVERAAEAVRRMPGVLFGPPGPWAVLASALAGDDRLGEAESVLREDLLRAEDVGLASLLVGHHRGLGDLKYAAGEWDEAIAEFETADEIAQEIGEARRAHVQLALVAIHRGRVDEAARLLELAATAVTTTRVLPWVRSLWHDARGDPDAASGALLDAADDLVAVPANVMPALALVDVARLAVRAGDRALAERAARRVAEDAERRDTPTARGNALRCRALLDDDADTLLAAVAEYRSGPRPLELALGCEDAAAALARAGRTAEASGAFREALEGFERLGAAWDVSRCQGTARACGIKLRVRRARSPGRTGWESLSPTERTVARLAAQGLSNPEIGRRLYISRRTVETHLSHVFAKLGLASRVELAGIVARLGDELLQGDEQS